MIADDLLQRYSKANTLPEAEAILAEAQRASVLIVPSQNFSANTTTFRLSFADGSELSYLVQHHPLSYAILT